MKIVALTAFAVLAMTAAAQGQSDYLNDRWLRSGDHRDHYQSRQTPSQEENNPILFSDEMRAAIRGIMKSHIDATANQQCPFDVSNKFLGCRMRRTAGDDFHFGQVLAFNGHLRIETCTAEGKCSVGHWIPSDGVVFVRRSISSPAGRSEGYAFVCERIDSKCIRWFFDSPENDFEFTCKGQHQPVIEEWSEKCFLKRPLYIADPAPNE